MTAPIADALSRLGLKTSKVGNQYCIRGTVAQAFSLLDWEGLGQSDKAYRLIQSDSSEYSQFSGGEVQKLRDARDGKIDMTRFKAAYARFQSTGLRRDLKAFLEATVPRRKRLLSEHDGDWSYDRRWEVCAFERAERVKLPSRVIEVDAYFGILGSSGSTAIDDYGATVFGICQLIEAAGFQTRVYWTDNAPRGVVNASVGMPIGDTDMKILVKEAGQYATPSLMASCMTSNFYRRIGLGMLVLAAESQGMRSPPGVGGVLFDRQGVKVVDGRILVGPDCHKGSTDALKDAIVKAIKG